MLLLYNSTFYPNILFHHPAAKDCPLGAITNGNIKGDIPLKPGSTATLTCGQDYKLTGGSVITCVAGEKFENDLPRCDGSSNSLLLFYPDPVL